MIFYLVIALIIHFFIVEAYNTKSIAATSTYNTTDGYVYLQYYTSDNCGGSKSFVEGYYADYCYQISTTFRKYKFTQGFSLSFIYFVHLIILMRINT